MGVSPHGLFHSARLEEERLEVGEFFHRSPITIRTWIRDGRLEVYHFRGKEYRITHSALEEFQHQERNGKQSRTQ